jgi:hypothetical protein
MEATPVSIPGLIVFTPQPHIDHRGLSSRTFDARIARRTGIDPAAFVQDSVSRSAKGSSVDFMSASVPARTSLCDAPRVPSTMS